ncbi:flagellar filament capping protein FliD [Cohnella thermotolerans]|uniref:flagellar filament capping protein FliD n=1 Tax=Cohnella thermotolerans TaxID=329858 RepID=UPI0004117CAC|nr:flagellar filament capping protein FliD [Cohnella thermotolerans]
MAVVMRITGLSSGMDIDKLVSDLMKAERIPVDKLKQKKDLISYQMELYREINTKVSAFRDVMSDLRYSSRMTGMKATSSSTNVTVAPTQVTSPSTHTLKVTQLADYAKASSASGITNFGLTGTKNVEGTTITQGVNDKIAIKLDNTVKVITLTPGDNYTASDLQAELQKQVDKAFGTGQLNVGLNGQGQLTFDPQAGTNGFKPQVSTYEIATGALANLGFSDGQSYRLNLTLSLDDLQQQNKFAAGLSSTGGILTVTNGGNSVTIDYSGTDSLQTIMSKVNASAAGVTMSYDSVNDKFTFTSKQTGASQQVQLDDSGGLLNALQIASGTNVYGMDAQGELDLVAFSSSTNVYAKDGITYTLNKASATDTITVTVASDPDSIVDNVKKFITAYNDLIDLINKRLSETRTQGYSPLTDDQKAAMSDDDIKLWEAKVKIGLLHNSSILRDAKNSLRSLLNKTVDGVSSQFNSLMSVGITTKAFTGVYVAEDQGKIELDEDKLRSAIAADPNAVNKLFTSNTGIDSQEGIFVGMYNKANSILSSLVKEAGRVNGSESDTTTTLGKQIYDLSASILDMNDKLSAKEDYYYKRFSAMEEAISKSNSTLSWLSSQFG